MEKKNVIEITPENIEEINKFGKKYSFFDLSFNVNGAYWHITFTDTKKYSREKFFIVENVTFSDSDGNKIADLDSRLIGKKTMVDKIQTIFDLPSAKNVKLLATTKTLSGYNTRAPSKKPCPVKVNFRKML